MDRSMQKLGFLGCGTLTEAVVAGLLAGDGGHREIIVSPRSEIVSRRLAERHAGVRRAGSNAELVEEAEIVFLAIRPGQLAGAAAGLPFRPDHKVVSFLAGTPRDVVAGAVRPAATVIRLNALPPIRHAKGPIVQFPADPEVEALFGVLGDLIVAESEGIVEAICNASALMSAHYEMQNRVVAWLESRAMPASDATRYVRSLYAGLAEIGRRSLDEAGGLDPAHHETPGGLNACGRRHLREAGWFDEVERALDVIEAHGRTLRS